MVHLGQLTTQRLWCRPKQVDSDNLLLINLTIHGTYFELTIGILPSRTKSQDVASLKKKKHLSPPINRGGFHGLSMKKIGFKVGQKLGFSPHFFLLADISLSFISLPPIQPLPPQNHREKPQLNLLLQLIPLPVT